MGKAAIVTKQLMQKNEFFADVVNFWIYGGEQKIQPEDLKAMDSVEVTVPVGKEQKNLPIERIRDTLKMLTAMSDGQVIYAIIGIENQTRVHYAMPVRNMVYDALSYAAQVSKKTSEHRKEKKDERIGSEEYLSGFYKNDRLLPVITLTVYFGEEEWNAPTSLYEMLDVHDKEVLTWVSDYRIPLIDPHQLTDEELNLFQSELREVLLYIKYSGDSAKIRQLLQENPRYSEMDYAAVQVINECTHTRMKLGNRKEEKVNMCKAIDDMKREAYDQGEKIGEKRGEKKGEKKGEKRGENKQLLKQICLKLTKGKSLEQIADELEENAANIQSMYTYALRFAPEYHFEQVYQGWQQKNRRNAKRKQPRKMAP